MRVFIACPDQMLRMALMLLLDNEPGTAVIGISDRLSGLPAQLESSEADVLLLDWTAPALSIVALLSDLRALSYRPSTIIISSKAEDEPAIREAGADYFISKNAPPDTLIPILNDIRLSRFDCD